METGELFNPKRYLTTVGGNDYLETKWRVYWFRSEHPNGTISTELIEHVAGNYAVFKASASKGYSGAIDAVEFDGGSATGYASETFDDFRDYLEKAETKALGRALAALGYGVQFAGDDFEDVDRIVPQGKPGNRSGGKSGGGSPKLATAEQFGKLKTWREAQGLTPDQMKTIIDNVTKRKTTPEDLTEQEAGRVLYMLNRKALADLLDGTNLD